MHYQLETVILLQVLNYETHHTSQNWYACVSLVFHTLLLSQL